MPRFTLVFCWSYLLLVSALLASTFLLGDRWWFATFVLFGPRWVSAVPLILLFPSAVVWNWRALLPLGLVFIVVCGPLMGLCLKGEQPRGGGMETLRVLSCNINAGMFDASALVAAVLGNGVDVVALQECPRELWLELPPGWQMLREGNLALLSRHRISPGQSLQALHPPHRWPRTTLLSCVIHTPLGVVNFCTVHLPSPRYGLLTVLDRKTVLSPARLPMLRAETSYRRRCSEDVRRVVASLPQPVIVAGDFNMPVESTIYRRDWGELHNAFSSSGSGYGWTERVSVRGIPIKVRIDHILTDGGFTARSCATGRDVGSDHLPLMADITRVPEGRKAMP